VDDLQSEKEQIEEMRAWWAENGRYVIAGVVLAVGLLIGHGQYTSNKLAAQVEASVLFESLAEHVFDGDLDEAEAVADELANNYANTSYAAQSKLAMSRLYMDKNRDQDAADVLNELIAMRGNRALRHVGRLRLARVLLYQDKAQEVIDLLAGQDKEAFAGLYAEMRGDAYAALGQIGEAGEAYRIALADASQTVNRGLVQMKLIDLPELTPVMIDANTPESVPVTEPDAEPISQDEAGESE
jgi:predicted negative regulator of RcsB-dependent stress response